MRVGFSPIGVKISGATSAPTARALDVIELLARAGEARLRFSDIVSELGLTQATAHAILTTLGDRGWAERDPVDKSFSLGPAAAVVAARLDAARPLTRSARAAAAAVHRDVGYPTSVVERIDDALVMTAIEGGDPRHPAGIPGDRIPYAPPFGVAFAAWDAPDEQRAWIHRAASTDPEVERRLRRILTRTRERGFDIDWTTPALAQHAQLAGTMRGAGLPPHIRRTLEQLLAEFSTVGYLSEDDPARETRPVVTIAAPVLDDRRRVRLIVGVHPLCALSAAQIDAIGQRLTKATAAVDCS
ncbi:helix-turn-helix domain-containing protein [Nocardia sp. CA2R105]|uniref:helix-turn-helix domain-containing protein n=1 Tax=Nocardia coffeae TaxID=2873381 RepID=UPI001CA6C615|nr:helix-turn-helix domain-containing protein [Nocardia coffeae]MBY8857194.1 helix-turn-helix domain-containing protein [Nocardia coffeae]